MAANQDGRLYVLDSASLGGADHKTPLSRTSQFSSGAAGTSGLATWLDAAGTRWVVAASGGPVHAETKFAMANGTVTNGAVAAFTLVEQNGAPTLQPQWVSHDLTSPVTPPSSTAWSSPCRAGVAAQRGAAARRPRCSTRSTAATGKQLWTSGTTITSFVPGVGPSAGDSQVYVVTNDGTLYAFGVPMER